MLFLRRFSSLRFMGLGTLDVISVIVIIWWNWMKHMYLLIDAVFCRAWQSFLVVLVVYTAWVSPFEFGFLMKPEGPLAITDNVVNGFFLIDIVLSFFVAYLDKNTYLLVDEPKRIALRYARTGLLFDVISSIPYEFIRKLLPHNAHGYGYFTMLRLWRIRRVSAMFER